MIDQIICFIKGHRLRWNLSTNPWTKPGELNLWCGRCQMTFKSERR